MPSPFLMRFVRPAKPPRDMRSAIYDYERDELVGLQGTEMTQTELTEARTDPTTDESTDR